MLLKFSRSTLTVFDIEYAIINFIRYFRMRVSAFVLNLEYYYARGVFDELLDRLFSTFGLLSAQSYLPTRIYPRQSASYTRKHYFKNIKEQTNIIYLRIGYLHKICKILVTRIRLHSQDGVIHI